MITKPLWHGEDPPKAARPEFLETSLLTDDPRFDFFARWYDAALRGQPLDWELQRRVALIPEEIWQSGADAVAAEIEKIEQLWSAEQASKEVRAHLATRPVENAQSAAPMMGHNRPPPDEVLPVEAAQITALEARLMQLEAQLALPNPPMEVIEEAAQEVEQVQQTLGAWLAGMLNISATEFFKELGKWSGRLAAAGCGAVALWAVGLLERLGPLVSALWQILRLLAQAA